MALLLNPEQTMLRDSARAFLSEQAPVAHLRALRDANDGDGFSRPLWARSAEMGFAGVLVAEAHGGLGLGLTDAAVIAEQLGHTLTPSPFLSSAVLGAQLLAASGHAALQGHWLPRIAAGQAITALALDEHAQHRPQTIAAEAKADSDGFLLSGQKCFVVDGHVADLLFVVAKTSAQGHSVFAVDPKAPGVQIERTAMADAHNAARIRFERVRLPADALLGPRDQEIGRASCRERVCVPV